MPLVGLGTYPLKEDVLSRTLNTAFELGYRSIDTAFAYHNEETIGEVLQKSDSLGQQVFVTSKLSVNDLYLTLHGRHVVRKKSTKKSYTESCKRLQKSILDLYLLHQPYSNYIDIYEEMVRLYESGKVRAVGVANFKKRQIERIIEKTGIVPAVNQIEVNPYNTRKGLIAYCKEKGIQVVAYSPFGRGLLTKELMNEGVLVAIAQEKQKSVAQVILRWLIQQDIVVIPRTDKAEKLAQNIQIFDFHLAEEEMQQIDQLNRNLFTGLGKLRVEVDDLD